MAAVEQNCGEEQINAQGLAVYIYIYIAGASIHVPGKHVELNKYYCIKDRMRNEIWLYIYITNNVAQRSCLARSPSSPPPTHT